MKTSVQQRLKQIMSERHLKQVDIIKMSEPLQKKLKIKMGKSTLSQYVNGIQSPDQDRIYLLSKTLNINEPWLMGYDVQKERIPDDERAIETSDITTIYNKLEPKRQDKVYKYAETELKDQEDNKVVQFKRKIPVALKTAASSTRNGYGNDTDLAEYEDMYTDREDLRNFSEAYLVEGDSMEPKFKYGDVVLVQRAYDVDNGSIYVVMHNEELLVKQVRINDGIFTMHSLNDKYDDINVTLDDAESYPVIVGRVVDSFTPLQVN